MPWLRFLGFSVLTAGLYALAVGIPTSLVPNTFFHRMLAPNAWNYLAWLLPAALFGPLMATYLIPWPQTCKIGGRMGTGGMLSLLAAGCPVCNKLVILAVGASGALDYFRPLQPLLGLASLALLGIALWLRVRARFTPTSRGATKAGQLEESAL